ncbi:MAG: DNA polymerase III subunit beta [Clostridia bacterium]|nr:DNA polymerase III subunit beta [Clostridia bacterium]
MKFILDADDLRNGVFSVIKALPVRSAMPVLDGILLEAKKEGLHLACSDLMFQKESLLEATVEEEGSCVVKGKFFAEVLRKLPSGSVEFLLEGQVLSLKCGRIRQRVQCIEYDEFPLMKAKGEQYHLTLPKDTFKTMVEHTVFAVSQDDSRPVLTGTLLEASNDVLSLVATDSFQFALTSFRFDHEIADRSTIVQGKVLSEIGKMAEEAEETVTLSLTPTHITVEVGNTRLTARLLDGNYIDYKRIIPKECKTRVLVNVSILAEMIDRAQLISREGNNSIQLAFDNNTMQIRAESYLGRVEDETEVQIVGDPIEIAFNPKYFINVLRNITDETVYLEFNSAISPCVVRPVQGDSYLYLIVPMRVY